jgi:hypothetical protein
MMREMVVSIGVSDMEYIYLGHPVASRLREAWCCCETPLGKADVSLLPCCGDHECREYLKDHPGWYDRDGVE